MSDANGLKEGKGTGAEADIAPPSRFHLNSSSRTRDTKLSSRGGAAEETVPTQTVPRTMERPASAVGSYESGPAGAAAAVADSKKKASISSLSSIRRKLSGISVHGVGSQSSSISPPPTQRHNLYEGPPSPVRSPARTPGLGTRSEHPDHTATTTALSPGRFGLKPPYELHVSPSQDSADDSVRVTIATQLDKQTTSLPHKSIQLPDAAALDALYGKDRMAFCAKCTVPAVLDQNSTNPSARLSSSKRGSFLTPTPLCTWSRIPGSTFAVRTGPSYLKNKRKAPSGESLYETVCLRTFRSLERTQHIAEVFPLPLAEAYPNGLVPCLKDNLLPEIMILHLQMPYDNPNMFRTKDDGEGGEVVIYMKPSQRFFEEMNGIRRATPATILFSNWCKTCVLRTEMRSRFKCMALARNFESLGLPWLKPYNGKPVLITDSGQARRGVSKEGVRFLEMSVNVHRWAFLAKKSFVSLIPKFKEMKLDVGFTVEALAEEEMPECVLGSVLISHIDAVTLPVIPVALQKVQ